MNAPILRNVLLPLLLFGFLPAHTRGAKPVPEEPAVAPASDEGERALRAVRIKGGLKGQLFAAEPLVANPVALDIDNRGRVFVCETFRQKTGVVDNRDFMFWLDDDLAAQSVADRLAYHQKHLKEKLQGFTRQDDRIRIVEDRDGDGHADRAHVFVAGFNDVVEGTGAGVLHHGDAVYYTCIPNLWRFRDADGDGRADQRQRLHTGYGVRVAFRGHDLHGLIVGPDGKLYFSIGDRGYNVQTASGGIVKDPESGAVFRCNLDGSQLEAFATGLRNPQELVFDDYGNLFTGDNNSDSGDEARWVFLPEGAEIGWRMAFQYLEDRGPWNREKMWHPYHEGQPAFIVPPISNFADGPSGVTYYPGTGLSDHFRGRFFLCDFRGASAQSGIRTFRLKPKGAFFELVDQEQTLWNLLATDAAFGPDGALYVSDWVHGWNGLGKGRIYRFSDPTKADDPQRLEVQRLLSDGLAKHDGRELANLLKHVDRRVRQAAQFELVRREDSIVLTTVANTWQKHGLARVHAIWGLGTLIAANRPLSEKLDQDLGLTALLDDDAAEIRAQTARVLGGLAFLKSARGSAARLEEMLADESPRARMFAAIGLGKIGRPASIEPLLRMLAVNANRDPILRHAAVMGLTGIGSKLALAAAANHSSPPARMGALLALRRLRSPEIVRFLSDDDESLVVEAARAVHDLPIPSAMPQLAGLISHPTESDPLLRRVLNANYRLGTRNEAMRLARFAARSDAPESLRLEALDMLADWKTPSGRDRVLGMWRPLPSRDSGAAVAAMGRHLPAMLSGNNEAVRVRAASIAARLGISDAAAALKVIVADPKLDGSQRASALAALAVLKDTPLKKTMAAALGDTDVHLRSAALRLLPQHEPSAAAAALARATTSDEAAIRQTAYAVLGTIGTAADQILLDALEQLMAGKIAADTQLDLIMAAEMSKSSAVQKSLQKFRASKPSDDPLAPYREALVGGDAARGHKVFLARSEVSCVRCHKVDEDGGDVGPNLTKIGKDKTREYLLEAIVTPSKTIAKEFQSIQVETTKGRILSGILRQQNAQQLELITPEGEPIKIPAKEIEEIYPVKLSAMPADLIKNLSLTDLRDLVEFLAQRRSD